jgi:LL-H family phage holin
MNTLVFNVLTAVIVALIGIVTKELLPFLRAKEIEAEAKLRRTKWAWAADIIDAVVRAVEQTVSGEIHGPGKKQKAQRIISVLLEQNGIQLSADQIDALIEASVQAMNEGDFGLYTEETDEQ